MPMSYAYTVGGRTQVDAVLGYIALCDRQFHRMHCVIRRCDGVNVKRSKVKVTNVRNV